jgi:para-nitrobenzyl esterase
MRVTFAALALGLALSLGLASPAVSQPPSGPDPADPGQPALIRLPAKPGKPLTVTTPAFKTDGDIPFENTQYRGNAFPGLAWSRGPKGTKTYAIIMQDTDLKVRGAPILHWSMFNIPAAVTGLPAGMAPDARPAGSAYGQNYRGANQPYLGPRTPPGPKHHYHLQVFALDTSLPDAAGVNFQAMLDAMNDHVLASGEVVGLGQVDPTAPPPPPRPAAPAAAAPAPK